MRDTLPGTGDARRSTDERTRALDRAFEVLGHRDRRRVLFAVLDRTDSGEEEAEVAVDDAVGGDDRIGARLYHVHLPKLAAAGYLAWDADRGVVAPGPSFQEIAPVVRLLRENRGALPEGVVPERLSG